jgi:hypothetical protein
LARERELYDVVDSERDEDGDVDDVQEHAVAVRKVVAGDLKNKDGKAADLSASSATSQRPRPYSSDVPGAWRVTPGSLHV